MQAYSLDLRQRVVAAYENGVETILEVAERFEVSDSFIKKTAAPETHDRRHRANRTSRRTAP
jgi:transposase